MSTKAPATSSHLQQLLNSAQLPALPQSAIQLLELSQDPDNGPPEYARPIEADPGLTSQVLRFVNSSYFGFSREISSVKLAIALVGVRTIKNFALWSAVFSLMPSPKCGPFDLKTLWKDSLRRGIFARRLGRSMGVKDVDELFAAALLQDMAIPLLAKELPQDYHALLDDRESGKCRLSNLERDRFGWTHAEAAVHVAHRWSLPERFVYLIGGHTETEKLKSGKLDPGAACVACSALLPSCSDSTWHERDEFVSCFRSLGGDAEQVVTTFQEIDHEFEEFAPLLKLSVTKHTLVETWRQTPQA